MNVICLSITPNKSLYDILITQTVTACLELKNIYAINFKVMKKSKEQIHKEKIYASFKYA